ncbi:MAG: ABC transporter substrate-binding protein [Gemmatimonadales bacterium]
MRRALCCAAVLLAACGDRRGPPPDTLRLAIINDPIMNAPLSPDIGSVLINKVIFPGLMRPSDSLTPEPDLATGYTVANGGRRYTFTLRPGVKWHDGHPFSAADVKFTFDQILDPTSGTLQWSDFSVVDSVTIADSLTVDFWLESPFAPFLTLLGHNAGILPAHAFTGKIADAVDFNRSHPIGTGPFLVKEAVPGSYVVLAANPDYYGDPPKLARIIFKIVPDVNTQVAQLRARELDLAVLEPANLRGLEDDPGLRIDQVSVPQHYYVGFNQQLPLFQPAAVRRALTLAVDRKAIIDGVLRGHGDLPQGTIPVALGEYFADTLPLIPYDTAAALGLLADAGWRRGADGMLRNAAGEPFRFTMLIDKGNPTREQAAVAVQQDFRRIGIDVSIETMEFASLVRDFILPKRHQAFLIWWNTPLDPDQYSYYATGQSNNDVAYSNAEVDRLLAAGRAELDHGRRVAIYHAFQAAEAADPPVLVLYYPRELQVRRAELHGLPALGIRDALRYSERIYFGDR